VVHALDALDPHSLPSLLFLAANIWKYSIEVNAMMSALVYGSEQVRAEQQAQLLLQVTPQLLQQLLECAAQSRADDVAGELCRVPGVAAALPGATCHSNNRSPCYVVPDWSPRTVLPAPRDVHSDSGSL
jgi:hypothetical protein